MSIRRDPFDEFENLFERMSRQFGDISEKWGGNLNSGGGAIDIMEKDEEYLVSVETPGFEREDIDVRMIDNSIEISAERRDTTEAEEEGRFIKSERVESINRTISLPRNIQRDQIEAELSNGVLRITIPKREEIIEEGEKIEIEGAED